MSVMTDERLAPGDLGQFRKKTKRLLMELVNGYDVRYRVIDGSHVLLYAGTREDGATLKVSASRPEEQTLDFIEKFAEQNVTDWRHVPEEKVERLAETVNSADTHKVTVEERPTPAERSLDEAPWQPYLNAKGVETNWFTRTEDGVQKWMCGPCARDGIETILTNNKSLGGHMRANHGERTMWTPEARQKALETKRANRVRNEVNRAVRILQEAVGDDESTEALKKKVETLTQERDEANRRVDELKTKLELMREAFRNLD